MQTMLSIATKILGCGLAISAVTGCAHSAVTPLRLRAGDWRQSTRPAPYQPVVLDFKAGDRIPVSIQVDGDVIETTPSPSVIWLTAKRDFSVRIRGSEIKTSLDGTHFDDKPARPGSFQLGLGPTAEGGPKLSLHVTTPVHAAH
jgi:hypothetical protein